jgi:predicted dithiol-disulfide oxidoreductase (DUF899 family)
MKTDHATEHPVVSREQWRAARMALLAREKQLTRLQDEIARERRALPWVRVEKDYVFDTLEGPARSANSSTAAASCWCSTSCSRRAGTGVQELLVHGRPQRRRQPAPGATRRHAACRLARAPRGHRALPPAHGMEVPLGVVEWHGLQPRFRRQLHADEMASGQVDYNYPAADSRTRKRRHQRLLPQRGREVFHTYSRFGAAWK